MRKQTRIHTCVCVCIVCVCCPTPPWGADEEGCLREGEKDLGEKDAPLLTHPVFFYEVGGGVFHCVELPGNFMLPPLTPRGTGFFIFIVGPRMKQVYAGKRRSFD